MIDGAISSYNDSGHDDEHDGGGEFAPAAQAQHLCGVDGGGGGDKIQIKVVSPGRLRPQARSHLFVL